MFCKHSYKVIETYRFDSIIERLQENLKRFSTGGSEQLLNRGVITVVQCDKCNNVKHIKTRL